MIAVTSIPHDPALPTLPTALDTAVVVQEFTRQLSENGRFHISACQIDRIKYKPGQKCHLTYTFTIEDNETGSQIQQTYSTIIYPAGHSESHYQKYLAKTKTAVSLGTPLLHLPALNMVAWAFPNDRKLHYLPHLMDAHYLRHHLLPPLIAAHLGPQWHIQNLHLTPIHYVPEHTCIIRLDLQLRHQQTGQYQPLSLYAKTYYNDDGAEAYQLMHALWQSPLRRNGWFHIPRPIGYHTDHRILWQEGVAGYPLIDVPMSSPQFGRLMAIAGKTVAALHQTAVSCSRTITHNAWQQKLVQMRDMISAARPLLAELTTPLIDKLLAESDRLPPPPQATLHGDLHLKNFLVNGACLTLIDLDSLHRGPAWFDLGSFVAGLLYRALADGLSPETAVYATAPFLQAYTAHTPWETPLPILNWHIATALIIERAFRCITRMKDGRLDLLDQLIPLSIQLYQMQRVAP